MRPLPTGRQRRRPNTFDGDRIRARSRQLVARLMDGVCGCCGRPAIGVWCVGCRPHIHPRGRVCERTYEARHGRPCPLREEP
jgi:hypothetical protein